MLPFLCVCVWEMEEETKESLTYHFVALPSDSLNLNYFHVVCGANC